MHSSLTTIPFNNLSRASALHSSSRDAAHLSSHDDAPYLVPPYSIIYRHMPPIFPAWFVRFRRRIPLNDLPLSSAMQLRLSLTTRISYPQLTIYSPSFFCMLYPRPSIIPLFSDGANSFVFDDDLTERSIFYPLTVQICALVIHGVYPTFLFPLSFIPLSSKIQSCNIVAGTDTLAIKAVTSVDTVRLKRLAFPATSCSPAFDLPSLDLLSLPDSQVDDVTPAAMVRLPSNIALSNIWFNSSELAHIVACSTDSPPAAHYWAHITSPGFHVVALRPSALHPRNFRLCDVASRLGDDMFALSDFVSLDLRAWFKV
ncbi:hypothetical protein R3P38DRAFT_3183222 [Favolaschia claudopus]|uniref:Uncharacterized protein n=1 Tax=Favolaschia claudopus TaxID=2862362 RepID=A0AAW0CBG6_9AGAR